MPYYENLGISAGFRYQCFSVRLRGKAPTNMEVKCVKIHLSVCIATNLWVVRINLVMEYQESNVRILATDGGARNCHSSDKNEIK